VKITILAVARLGRGAEAMLARDYAERASAAGRALGLGPIDILEVESKKPGKEAEADAILAAAPEGAYLIACDEHGVAHPSRAFAERIAKLRDGGERRLVIVIGGADGLSPRILDAAREKMAFGVQTWPHALVRAMLAEQIYRAVTILGGSPYHRD
jgi:23S rRNA (pseudouridine1915-N3)-methyltransferase